MGEHSLLAIAILVALYTIIERSFITSPTFFRYYLAFSLLLVGMLLV